MVANPSDKSSDKPTIYFYDELSRMYYNQYQIFLETDCQYFLYIEENYIVETDIKILNILIDYDKDIIAPLLKKNNSIWSNYWGDLGSHGYYAKSFDYMDIVNYNKKGCWNVPYVNGFYLIKRNVIEKNINDLKFKCRFNFEMSLCEYLRKKYIFIYLTNIKNFGYIE